MLCSFTVAAPTEWNKLPQAVRTYLGIYKTVENVSFQISLSSTMHSLSPLLDANMDTGLFLELVWTSVP